MSQKTNSPITRKSGRPLQKETDGPFTKPVSFRSFLQTLIPLRSILSSMPTLRYVLGSLGVATRGQTNVEEGLRTIAGFGRRIRKG